MAQHVKHTVGEGVPLADLTQLSSAADELLWAQQADYTELVLLSGGGLILSTLWLYLFWQN